MLLRFGADGGSAAVCQVAIWSLHGSGVTLEAVGLGFQFGHLEFAQEGCDGVFATEVQRSIVFVECSQ